MIVDISESSTIKIKAISFDGKLFVTGTTFPTSIKNALQDDEKLYLETRKDTIGSYKFEKTINGTTIEISNVFPSKPMQFEEFLLTLRKLAQEIYEFAPRGAQSIIVGGTVKIDGECICQNDSLELKDPRRNRPDILFISEKARDEYYKDYKKVIKSKTRERSFLKDILVIAIGRYAIINYAQVFAVLNTIDNILSKSDPIFYISGIGKAAIYLDDRDKVEPYVKYLKGITIQALSKNIKLYSPKTIPNNAFLIDVSSDGVPLYIQFTKSGVAWTKGVYFINDTLDEVESPWYVVKRFGNRWEIFLYVADEQQGEIYVIDEKHRLIKNGDKPKNDNEIYSSNIQSIMFQGNIIIQRTFYDRKVPAKNLERVKIAMPEKTVYVPRIMVKYYIEIFD